MGKYRQKQKRVLNCYIISNFLYSSELSPIFLQMKEETCSKRNVVLQSRKTMNRSREQRCSFKSSGYDDKLHLAAMSLIGILGALRNVQPPFNYCCSLFHPISEQQHLLGCQLWANSEPSNKNKTRRKGNNIFLYDIITSNSYL